MDTTKTRETIKAFYQVLNSERFAELAQFISPEYRNDAGDKGIDGFTRAPLELAGSFLDAHWQLEDIWVEGNMAIVKQIFTGKHIAPFQNIPSTQKTISVEGIVFYEFKNGKIVHSRIHTDRLGFLQQLGLSLSGPETSIGKNHASGYIYFIDKFFVPLSAKEKFLERTTYNRKFIKTLPGFISDQIFFGESADRNLITIITIAVWQDQDKLNKAKSAVQAEYQRIGFNPAAFMQQLGIQMERGQYQSN